jgi:phage I-like protein
MTIEAYTDDAGNLCLLRELPPGEEPPTKLVFFEAGINPTTKGDLLFDAVSDVSVMSAYRDKGQELLPFDYDHGMVGFITTPDSGKAAGWFRPSVEGGALVANEIQWTPAADKAIRDREFRHFSPAVKLDRESRPPRVMKLINAAITNLPATIGQKPMVASETTTMPGKGREDTSDTMSNELLKLLGAETEAGAIGLVTQLHQVHASLFTELSTPQNRVDGVEKILPAIQALKATSLALAEEVRDLKAEAEKGKLKAKIAELHDAHKLSDAQHDWALTQTLESLEKYGEVTPPRHQNHDPKGSKTITVTLTDEDRSEAERAGMTVEEFAEEKARQAEADKKGGLS